MRPEPRPIVVRPLADLTLELVLALHARAARDEAGLFLAEGARFLHQAALHGGRIAGLVLCPARLRGSSAGLSISEIERRGVPVLKLTEAQYRILSPGASEAGENVAAGQGLLVVLRQRWSPLPDRLLGDECWIGVESVRSPGNLGTLLRSGDAAGATGMIVFDRSEEGSPSGVDPYSPAAVRATMGSIFARRFVRTTHRAFRRWPLRREVAVWGATGEAGRDYRSPDYRRPVVLMLGDERKGLSPGGRGACDGFVSIPMVGSPDSLNLAMAGTLALYEVLNQRRPLGH